MNKVYQVAVMVLVVMFGVMVGAASSKADIVSDIATASDTTTLLAAVTALLVAGFGFPLAMGAFRMLKKAWNSATR